LGAEISGKVMDLSQIHSAEAMLWSGSAFCILHKGIDAIVDGSVITNVVLFVIILLFVLNDIV